MANFFSSAPIDLGADHIARGWSSVTNSINRMADDRNERIKMTLANRMRMDEDESKRVQAITDRYYEVKGSGATLPLDSQGKLDIRAAMGAIGDYQRMRQDTEARRNAEQRNRAELEAKARELGVNIESPSPLQGNGWSVTAQPGQKHTGFAGEPAGAPESRPLEERVAEAQRRLSTDTATEAERAKTREGERTRYRTAFGKDPTATELDDSGQLNARTLKDVADHDARSKLTQTQRNAEYAVDQGIKAGHISPEDREQAVAVASTQIMGRFPLFPQTERDAAVGNAKYMQSLDALNELAQASATSGRNDFGPVANRFKNVVGSVTGAFPEARTLEQVYKEAGSTKAFGEGGKQLTESEKELTFGQIGAPTDDDFPERLSQHRARAVNVIELQLNRLKDSPYRFTPDGQAAIRQLEKALAGATGGAESMRDKSNPAKSISEMTDAELAAYEAKLRGK